MPGRIPKDARRELARRHHIGRDDTKGEEREMSFDNFFEETVYTSFDGMESFQSVDMAEKPHRPRNMAQLLLFREGNDECRRSRSPSPSSSTARSGTRSLSPSRRRFVLG